MFVVQISLLSGPREWTAGSIDFAAGERSSGNVHEATQPVGCILKDVSLKHRYELSLKNISHHPICLFFCHGP